MAIPKIQKAWQLVNRGPPKVALRVSEDVPVLSSLKSGEVLVKVHAGALNPLENKLMEYIPNLLALRPHTAGYDFSGVIVDGNGTEYNAGDEVYGILRPYRSKGQGSLGQYISTSAKFVALKPGTISMDEAAGLGIVGVTAYGGLLDYAQLQPGQHVFVNGGTSSVGNLVIQLAKAIGCKVTASTSTKNIDTVKGLGADEIFDYNTQGKPHIYYANNPPTPPFHVIYDAVGDEPVDLYLHSEKYLAHGGIFISVGAQIPYLSEIPKNTWGYLKIFLQPIWLGGLNRKWMHFSLGGVDVRLSKMNEFIKEGKVRPLVDSTYAFEDAVKAYERLASGRAVGKVIVRAPA